MKRATVEVGNKRLLKLAKFLQTVPRERFDYNTFVGDDWKGAQNLSCGTQACALGWAATMPTFRRLGLYLKQAGYPALKGDTRSHAFEVAAKLFGISIHDAHDLFSPMYNWDAGIDEGSATPKYVARKIRNFVKDRAVE